MNYSFQSFNFRGLPKQPTGVVANDPSGIVGK